MHLSSFKKYLKGFTLIELLLVISIIGLLSTIVVASLNDARDRAILANIQENTRTMRNQAEIYYSKNNTYGSDFSNDCPTSPSNTNIFTQSEFIEAVKSALDASPGTDAWCEISGNKWAVTIDTEDGQNRLNIQSSFGSNETAAYCFDSDGDIILQNGAGYDESIRNGSCVENEI